MTGYIKKAEVLSHPYTVVHEFGWKVFIRCLVARRGTTFLSVVYA